MNKLKIAVAALIVVSGFYACKPKGFTKLKSGLEYMIVKDEKGDKKATVGSIIKLHIRSTVGDSVLFDSYKQNNNEPVPAQVTAPNFNGDVMEGLTLLTEGDSAVFQASADSIFRGEGGKPPFVKKGDIVKFTVKMVSIKSKEEFEADMKKSAEKQIGVDDKLIQEYIQKNGLTMQKTASGIYYSINKAGSGANAAAGQEVTMNYTGMLLNGTKFDSNEDPAFGHKEPFKFKLGAGMVIKGWEEGIALLNPGSKATLLIPSPLAYGERSMPGNQANPGGLPANSVLRFDLEVVSAK
jgi:FKBP-type peptidyl-prolyl cis-trans isomerase